MNYDESTRDTAIGLCVGSILGAACWVVILVLFLS